VSNHLAARRRYNPVELNLRHRISAAGERETLDDAARIPETKPAGGEACDFY